jgi:class 3 adenylate cyclase/tetratricopeptide (TPR) repeat protein
MKCPNCQHENPDTQKFCGECGAKLEKPCPDCGVSNPPQYKFCGECGHTLEEPKEALPIDFSEPQSYTPKHLADKILTTRSSIEGERKLVTVLFADVVNYTSISEKLDPEEAHQIMDGAFKILMDEIHRYEGTINQFTGDGVMALFGAPVAHEDHAQRACYTALSVQKAIGEYGQRITKDTGVDFIMRVGLNSGPVIVGSIGDDLRMDYTAVGDTTNLAARIQQSAKPGEIWLSQDTQSIIRGFFKVNSVGDLELKGKAEPEPAYRLVAEHKEVRTRFEAGLAKGVTELVGRRPEMEILKTTWGRARSGEARVVDVVGEAGVGKSRLAYEFQNTISDEATILTGVCIHYGRNINFLPLIDIVKGAFEIKEGMSEEEAGQCIEKRAVGDLESMIPFYRNLLSLKVDDAGFNSLNPEGRKFGTFEAVKNLLLSLSEDRPLVVFLEDIHWIDKISEEFFVFFSHSIQGRMILMLSAYRPEGAPGWAKGPYYRHLGLETLSEKSSGHLVQNILGGLALDRELEKVIVGKTGGNPFFVEEMVRELLDRDELIREGDQYISRQPIDHLDIPGTVQGVLAARMDRVSEDLKRTMQVASVIGRDFAYKILRSIMELGDELRAHLTNLVGIEVLYEKALYPELEYIFKHALTQEVAYESLLKQRRREIHGRIALTIEELYADRLEQHYELLAHHWELSDSPNSAIGYLVLAGEKSNQSQAASAAVNFFTRALNQIERPDKAPDPNLMLRIRAGRAGPLHTMGKIEESLVDYQEAIRVAREVGDQQMLLGCLTGVPMLIYNTKLKDEVPHFCEQGLELARVLGDEGAEARIMASYAYWRYLWKGSDEYETFYQALGIAEKSGQPAAMSSVRLLLSVLERWRGNSQRSLELAEGMVEGLQSAFNIFLASLGSFVRGMALTDVGRYNEAIRFQNQWIDILEQNAIYLNLGRCYNGLGWTYSEVYDLENALQLNNRALENVVTLRRSPAMAFTALEMKSQAEVNLMENKFEMGKVDDAWEHMTRFEKESAHPDYDLVRYRWSTRMKDLKGTIVLSRGDLEGAEEIAKDCLDTATKRGMKKYVGKAERLFGQILTMRGAYDLAEAELKSALAKLEEVGNPKQLWMTRTALARVYEKMKTPDLGREQWQAAGAIVEYTADGLQDEGLRRTFLNAAPVREIIEHANR